MEATNPYQAPSADVSDLPDAQLYDQTSPLSPSGRFGRLSYLAWGAFIGFIAAIIVGMVMAAIVTATGANTLGLGAQLTLQLIMAMPLIMFAIRRLHDTGASGGWAVLLIIPLLNILISLYLLIKKGDPQANRFGPPRQTRTWEKVVGGIAVGLMILALIGVIAALVIPNIVPR